MAAIRTFIAVELSEVVRSQIADAVELLRQSLPGIRWVAPRSLHLTFKFLGDVEADKIQRVLGHARNTAERFAPFSLSFSGFGVFPDLRRPRVIWVGLETGREELIAVQKAVEDALASDGFPRDDKAFKPHLTVGRVRTKKPILDLGKTLNTTAVRSDPQQVDHIAVYKSDLTPEGPIYTVLGRYELLGTSS